MVCIGCGCTEQDACDGGCRWVWVSTITGEGLCSTCAVFPLEELAERIAARQEIRKISIVHALAAVGR
jgi:hypothetical protein